MSRDLLVEADSRPSALAPVRRWEVWPVSITAHALFVGWLFVMPLVAPPALPAIPSSFAAYLTPAGSPPPPPPRPVSLRELPESMKSPTAAPIDAPSGVAPETGVELLAPETVDRDLRIGTVVGIEGGLSVEPVEPLPRLAAVEPPIRTGGRIVAPARLVHVSPVYPPLAIGARVEGVVIIEATIGRDGRVEDARVLRSVPLLDDAALDAVRQWRYTPTLLNGVPVRVLMTVTVQFALRNEV